MQRDHEEPIPPAEGEDEGAIGFYKADEQAPHDERGAQGDRPGEERAHGVAADDEPGA